MKGGSLELVNLMPHRTSDTQRFEELVLPHLNAAYNLARWLTRSDTAAQDVVQESCLRAFRAFPRFVGGNARAWLLTIVRNQCYTWLKASAAEPVVEIDDGVLTSDVDQATLTHGDTPEAGASQAQDREILERALQNLPIVFREVIVLKDLEDMSYKEIAALTGVPIGTVMSRLSRAREMLRKILRAIYA